jgi:hypothetical protein
VIVIMPPLAVSLEQIDCIAGAVGRGITVATSSSQTGRSPRRHRLVDDGSPLDEPTKTETAGPSLLPGN